MNSKLFYVGILFVSCNVDAFSAAMKPWGHYSTIGFGYEERPEDEQTQAFMRFTKLILEDPSTEKIPFETDSNPMFRSATPSGAELWCAVTQEKEVLGLEPHFFGSSRVPVRVTKTNKDWSGLEAWLEARKDDGFPLEFFACPNYAMHKDRLKSNPFVDIQLAAFAGEIETFDTLEKYDEEQSKLPNLKDIKDGTAKKKKPGLAMCSKSFALASVFDKTKTCHAVFTGHVIKAEQKVNEKTGQPFYWALVSTLCGIDVDVVIDPNCLKYYNCSPPKVGGVIRGYFWLSGRIVTEPVLVH